MTRPGRPATPVTSSAVDQVPSSQATASPDPTRPAHRSDWYPDPTGRFEFRYHNGMIWTGDVSADGNRFLDPLPSATAAPETVEASSRQIPSAQVPYAPIPFAEPSGTGRSRAAFVLGLSSFLVGWVPFLCIVAIAAAVVGIVLGIGVLRRDARSRRDGGANADGHSYAVAGVVLAPIGLLVSGLGIWLSALAIREVNEFSNVGAHHTTDVSCKVDDGIATYTGTITNDSSEAHSYHVTIEFLRPDTSVRMHITSTTVDDVAPGDTATVSVDEVVAEDDLDCNVVDVTGPLPFGQS